VIEKTKIVDHLGEAQVMLPALLHAALQANDRTKLRMTALQAAVRHALSPSLSVSDFSQECQLVGIESVSLTRMIVGASATGENIVAPGLTEQFHELRSDVGMMLRAIAAGDPAIAEPLQRRSEETTRHFLNGPDQTTTDRIAQLISATHGGPDSLHKLVMDMHKVLNRLSAEHAERELDGAHVHGLEPGDELLVRAFMRGLNRTKALKFNHPGLMTTAARHNQRLVIQNDIGTTDAHVLVVTILPSQITVTYTDVHRARAHFFVGRFRSYDAEWSSLAESHAMGIASNSAFYLVTGILATRAHHKREEFLEAVGASLVFLIDWNKARKALRKLVDKTIAIEILEAAADTDIGHRGFLELGGLDLVAGSIRRVARDRIGFGERLETLLGRDDVVSYLKEVLTMATQGLLRGRADRAIRDDIDADLARRLETSEAIAFTTMIRQAGLARDLSTITAKLITSIPDADLARALAGQAKEIETAGDQLALDARALSQRHGHPVRLQNMVDTLENAIDDLEQCAFLASQWNRANAVTPSSALIELVEACCAASATAAIGADAASLLTENLRVDVDDALMAINRLVEIEHNADRLERLIWTEAISGTHSACEVLPLIELSRTLERATDRFAQFGHLLRDHILSGLSGR
jgi:uncharacterized protein Yka (UPF0111/DUF47 family)